MFNNKLDAMTGIFFGSNVSTFQQLHYWSEAMSLRIGKKARLKETLSSGIRQATMLIERAAPKLLQLDKRGWGYNWLVVVPKPSWIVQVEYDDWRGPKFHPYARSIRCVFRLLREEFVRLGLEVEDGLVKTIVPGKIREVETLEKKFLHKRLKRRPSVKEVMQRIEDGQEGIFTIVPMRMVKARFAATVQATTSDDQFLLPSYIVGCWFWSQMVCARNTIQVPGMSIKEQLMQMTNDVEIKIACPGDAYGDYTSKLPATVDLATMFRWSSVGGKARNLSIEPFPANTAEVMYVPQGYILTES